MSETLLDHLRRRGVFINLDEEGKKLTCRMSCHDDELEKLIRRERFHIRRLLMERRELMRDAKVVILSQWRKLSDRRLNSR